MKITVVRMFARYPGQTLGCRPVGSRKRGRKQRIWKENMNELIQDQGISEEDAEYHE
jgi:hypothetical protein